MPTDDPLHGHQEGRFLHGYDDCYSYLPLDVFCGRHLLAARLRRSNIDASAGALEEVARIIDRIRERWPRARIVLRTDSGFARDALISLQSLLALSPTEIGSKTSWPSMVRRKPRRLPPRPRPQSAPGRPHRHRPGPVAVF
jgi:hypothetical protein